MSIRFGRLFAVLLAASFLASPSVISTPPQEVLARSDVKFDPTPSFGPMFHFIRGMEVHIYLPKAVEPTGGEVLLIFAFALGASIVMISLIPACQWILVRLRLMD